MPKLLQTYRQLPSCFYEALNNKIDYDVNPYLFNQALAHKLELDQENKPELINDLLENHYPHIAQAYAGHQFGNFSMLGDGRARLIGEYQSPGEKLYDIQLKGSGRTSFSKRGDGKATLSAMLREYIYSEALAALQIPTTRSLAILSTSEKIYRQTEEEGAILIRIASSHIRVGTFEYAAALQDKEVLTELMDYSIKRHYPHIEMNEKRAYAFLKSVIDSQAKLISEWSSIGFIHGVMNTDNMTISGETIDFGPCAFMNRYDLDTCFSSIDVNGRYAFGSQPSMAKWNLFRLAECLLPFLSTNEETAIKIVEQLLNDFDRRYEQYWLTNMSKKIGFQTTSYDVKILIEELLSLMQQHQLDYHNTFYSLTYQLSCELLQPITIWIERWHKLLKAQDLEYTMAQKIMKQVNPVVIPRNHIVEEAIYHATVKNNQLFLKQLLEDIKSPYAANKSAINYIDVPLGHDDNYQTFCGT